MPLLPNINVGTAPNDGTGDTIRNAFIKVNENFQFIESFFPNTDVANLTPNITSTGTSTFNVLNAATIGNTGAAVVASTVNSAAVNSATIGNAGSTLIGSTVNAATIGNAGATLTGATLNAATIGNSGSLIEGTLTTASQPNITAIGPSLTSNISILGNIILENKTIANARAIQLNSTVSGAGGSFNIGFLNSNSTLVSFFMTSNINLTLVGTVEAGIQKEFYFINNTATEKSANIFVNSNRTNKGTNSISIASNTVTLIKMVSIDTTSSNIVAIISNT